MYVIKRLFSQLLTTYFHSNTDNFNFWRLSKSRIEPDILCYHISQSILFTSQIPHHVIHHHNHNLLSIPKSQTLLPTGFSRWYVNSSYPLIAFPTNLLHHYSGILNPPLPFHHVHLLSSTTSNSKTPTNFSPKTVRIAWLLTELSLPYENIFFARNENKRAPSDMSSKSGDSLGKSPVLHDGDLILTESGAITELVPPTLFHKSFKDFCSRGKEDWYYMYDVE